MGLLTEPRSTEVDSSKAILSVPLLQASGTREFRLEIKSNWAERDRGTAIDAAKLLLQYLAPLLSARKRAQRVLIMITTPLRQCADTHSQFGARRWKQHGFVV